MRINVTRSSMPPMEEYVEEIRSLWDSHWLTNNGEKLKKLEAALKERLDVPCALSEVFAKGGAGGLELAEDVLGILEKRPVRFTYPDDAPDFRESKRRNYEYFMPYLELADRFGCGIAIENMADGFSTHRRPGGVYCSTHVELCDLVDSFHVSNVGICWDFGHANLMGIDQREALRVMGKRLKATHVADNSGKLDDHILPFQGNVNWRSILPVLSEIGYEGDLTFEIHNSTSRLPDHLVDATAALCEQVGRYLLDLANDKIHNETYGHTC